MNKIEVIQKGHGYTARLGDSFSHAFATYTDFGTINGLYFTDIDVDEKQRGKGIGKKLVNAIIKKSGVSKRNVHAVKIIPKAVPFWKALEIKEGKAQFDNNKKLREEREVYIKDYLHRQQS